MSVRVKIIALIFMLYAPFTVRAATLLYLEAQAVGGYGSSGDSTGWYSQNSDDAMQKPGLGFDLLHRISSDTGDVATLALQARIVYDEMEDHDYQTQLYNAYARFNTPLGFLWAGHNRPAMGLSANLDSHALLLPALPMKGYGYDRDWGAGYLYEFENTDIAMSLTTGSGMPLYPDGSHMAAARYSYGVLNRDNFNTGISGAWGSVYDTMGYEKMMEDPGSLRIMGADATFFWERFEARLEIMGGEKFHEDFMALFGRFGVNFMEENRLKLEFQPVYIFRNSGDTVNLYTGATLIALPELTLRCMYHYDREADDHRFVAQAYYYGKLI
jgi:hypothetical protein